MLSEHRTDKTCILVLKADDVDRREINSCRLHAEYALSTQAIASAINQFFNGQLGATSEVYTPP